MEAEPDILHEGVSLAEVLRKLRRARGLTQEDLASISGTSVRTIRNIESGRIATPARATITALTAALDISAATQEEWLEYFSVRRRPDAYGQLPPCQLPADIPHFIGRDSDYQRLVRVLRDTDEHRLVPVIAITGPPGIGKSALAIHAAHRLRAHFPDGQLYIRLTRSNSGPRDISDVLAELLRSLHLPAQDIPDAIEERSTLFRSLLARRRVLIVAEDAIDSHDVRSLIPGMPGSALLFTSRMRLAALESVIHHVLGPLSEADALDLLRLIIGAERVNGEPAAAAKLVAACAHVPLAIRIAAARLAARPVWPIGELAAILADTGHRLDGLVVGEASMRASIESSYEAISPEARRVLRVIAGLPLEDFAEWVVSLVLEGKDPHPVIDHLIARSILSSHGPDQTGRVRFAIHDLVRDYARERSREDPAGEVAAFGRVVEGYRQLATLADATLPLAPYVPRAPAAVGTGPVPQDLADRLTGEPMAWFTAEGANLLAITAGACRRGDLTAAADLAERQVAFHYFDFHYDEARRLWETIARAGRESGAEAVEARARLRYAVITAEYAGATETAGQFEHCIPLLQRTNDLQGVALAQYFRAFWAERMEDFDQAGSAALSGLEIARSAGDRHTELLNLRVVGIASVSLGYPQAGLELCHQALRIAQDLEETSYESLALHALAKAQLAACQYAEAEETCRVAIDPSRRAGHAHRLPDFETLLGMAHYGRGLHSRAAEVLAHAAEFYGSKPPKYMHATCLYWLARSKISSGDSNGAVESLLQCRQIIAKLGLSRFGKRVQDALLMLGESCRLQMSP